MTDPTEPSGQERVPKPGDTYLDTLRGREVERTIVEVDRQYDDGGWSVLLDNNTYYDCYWNGEAWQYFPPEEQS